MKKSLLDSMKESLSEIAVKRLLGLPADMGMEVNIPIGKETAGVVVIPWECSNFSIYRQSISKDILIFTSVKENHVRVLGWMHANQIPARASRKGARIKLSVANLESAESLHALVRLRSANTPFTGGAAPPGRSTPQHEAQPAVDPESNPFVVRFNPLDSAGHFPSADTPDEDCQRFVKLACHAMPIAMMDRLRRREGALLWITRFADGTITAEASDMSTEHPSVTNQLWQEPGTGEIAVILANAEVPWDRSSVCDGRVGFWEGMLSVKESAVQ
jgi:hypothetical protein